MIFTTTRLLNIKDFLKSFHPSIFLPFFSSVTTWWHWLFHCGISLWKGIFAAFPSLKLDGHQKYTGDKTVSYMSGNWNNRFNFPSKMVIIPCWERGKSSIEKQMWNSGSCSYFPLSFHPFDFYFTQAFSPSKRLLSA